MERSISACGKIQAIQLTLLGSQLPVRNLFILSFACGLVSDTSRERGRYAFFDWRFRKPTPLLSMNSTPAAYAPPFS